MAYIYHGYTNIELHTVARNCCLVAMPNCWEVPGCMAFLSPATLMAGMYGGVCVHYIVLLYVYSYVSDYSLLTAWYGA